MPTLREIEEETRRLESTLFKKSSADPAAPVPAAAAHLTRTQSGVPMPPSMEEELRTNTVRQTVIPREDDEMEPVYGADEVLYATYSLQTENLLSISQSIKSLTYKSDKKFVRWIRHNSKEMERVTESVDNLLYALTGNYDLGEERNLEFILEHFQEVVNCCDDYIDSHEPKTKEGKLRLELVQKMRDEAAMQKESFRDKIIFLAHHYNYEDARLAEVTAMDVFTLSRTASFSSKTPGVSISTAGGGTSTVYVVKNKEQDKKLFFKEREKTDDITNESLQQHMAQISAGLEMRTSDKSYGTDADQVRKDRITKDLLDIMRSEPLPDVFQRFIDNALRSGTTLNEILPMIGFSSAAHPLRQYCRKLNEEDSKAALELIGALSKYANSSIISHDYAQIEYGSELSCRNVATTRLSDLLGISSIVTRSEMADVTLNGKELKGVVMEEAKGITMTKLMTEQAGKTFHYSPEALKQLSTLQIFDILCGQIDRHQGNYFVQYTVEGNDVTVTGVKAFDNDLSFGTLDYATLKSRMVSSARCPEGTDPAGQSISLLPCIDAEFARTIEALPEATLKFVLADILSPAEIDAALNRLQGLKDFIAKTAENDRKNNTEVIIEGTESWTQRCAAIENMSDQQKKDLATANYAMFDLTGKQLQAPAAAPNA